MAATAMLLAACSSIDNDAWTVVASAPTASPAVVTAAEPAVAKPAPTDAPATTAEPSATATPRPSPPASPAPTVASSATPEPEPTAVELLPVPEGYEYSKILVPAEFALGGNIRAGETVTIISPAHSTVVGTFDVLGVLKNNVPEDLIGIELAVEPQESVALREAVLAGTVTLATTWTGDEAYLMNLTRHRDAVGDDLVSQWQQAQSGAGFTTLPVALHEADGAAVASGPFELLVVGDNPFDRDLIDLAVIVPRDDVVAVATANVRGAVNVSAEPAVDTSPSAAGPATDPGATAEFGQFTFTSRTAFGGNIATLVVGETVTLVAHQPGGGVLGDFRIVERNTNVSSDAVVVSLDIDEPAAEVAIASSGLTLAQPHWDAGRYLMWVEVPIANGVEAMTALDLDAQLSGDPADIVDLAGLVSVETIPGSDRIGVLIVVDSEHVAAVATANADGALLLLPRG